MSLHDPTEEEAQKLLEKGTEALEMGDMELAKVRKATELRPTYYVANTNKGSV